MFPNMPEDEVQRLAVLKEDIFREIAMQEIVPVDSKL